ncbi:hypothetical protein V6N13_063983 [Hibiscus sabdariffa]
MDISRLWFDDQFEFLCSGAVGRSGGILSIWDKSRFSLKSTVIDPNFILLNGEWLPEKIPLIMVNVYAPCQVKEQEALWERIAIEIEKDKCCKVLGGDFNAISNRGERSGCKGPVPEESCNIRLGGSFDPIKLQLQWWSYAAALGVFN